MADAPPLVHIQFLACPEDDPDLGPWRIRKWSTRPFEGAQAYAAVAAGHRLDGVEHLAFPALGEGDRP